MQSQCSETKVENIMVFVYFLPTEGQVYCIIQSLDKMNLFSGDHLLGTMHHGDRLKTSFQSLPNDKILDWSKLKAFADDKINVT